LAEWRFRRISFGSSWIKRLFFVTLASDFRFLVVIFPDCQFFKRAWFRYEHFLFDYKIYHPLISESSYGKGASFFDDYQLWQAFKAGSKPAFDHLYEAYFSALYGYGTRLCGDRELVKDCIQTLFVELWHHRTQVADVRCIKYYLYRCLRRKIIRVSNQDRRLVRTEDFPKATPSK
jgi:hypothetical protein